LTEPAVVRAANLSDVPALGRLGALLVAVHHAFDPERFIAVTPATEQGYAAFLAAEIERPDALVLIAEAEGGVVGYAYGALEGSDFMALRGPAGILYDLLVDPGHRGQGIGRALLAAALEALAARGAPRILISAAEGNEAAQRMFAAAGFRRTMIEMTRATEAR
jgi:ribosomal protein S18 acetylase RimI-like enzyme